MRTVNDSCFIGLGGYGGGMSEVLATKGELNITKFDTTHKIVSGTFWFDIPTKYCDTLKIRHGRFDIRYRDH